MVERNFAVHGSLQDVRPVMVSGVYRSATTFVAALLGSHPGLCSSSSAVKYLRFCIGRYGDLRDPLNRRQLVCDCQRRLKSRWDLNLDVEEILDGIDAYLLGLGLGDSACNDAIVYHHLMCHLHGINPTTTDVCWVDKTALQWSSIPLFLSMFPQGRVVHVIRDPRDVTSSYKQMTFETGNTFLDAAFNCRSSMELAGKLSPEQMQRVCILRVEDLSSEPAEQLRKLYTFLDLPFSSDLLDANSFDAAGEDWRTNTSFGGSYKGWPKPGSRWQTTLSRTEVQFVELITQPYLSQYGYASSGFVPTAQDWQRMYDLLDSDFLKQRFECWFNDGIGSEGYRTNPVEYELRLVFPERYGHGEAGTGMEES